MCPVSRLRAGHGSRTRTSGSSQDIRPHPLRRDSGQAPAAGMQGCGGQAWHERSSQPVRVRRQSHEVPRHVSLSPAAEDLPANLSETPAPLRPVDAPHDRLLLREIEQGVHGLDTPGQSTLEGHVHGTPLDCNELRACGQVDRPIRDIKALLREESIILDPLHTSIYPVHLSISIIIVCIYNKYSNLRD